VTYAVAGLVAAAFVGVLVTVAGALWTNPRPFVVDGVAPLIAHPADNGFPSDHTALGFAVAGVVTWFDRRLGVVALVLAALLGVCRVLAHVHHVPDVVGGALVGLLAAALGVLGARVATALWDRARLGTASS